MGKKETRISLQIRVASLKTRDVTKENFKTVLKTQWLRVAIEISFILVENKV